MNVVRLPDGRAVRADNIRTPEEDRRYAEQMLAVTEQMAKAVDHRGRPMFVRST